MTPNDIGREGKLTKLDLRKGDRFEHIWVGFGGVAVSDTHAKLDCLYTRDSLPFGRFTDTYRITYRAPRDTAHVIHSSDGQTYDLSTNRIVFGELPEDVQNAFRAWEGPVSMLVYGGKWPVVKSTWNYLCCYRVVLPPPETTITVTVPTVDGKPVPGTYTDAAGNVVTVK